MSHLDVTDVPVEQLLPYPGNARRGDVEVIRESLRRNGVYKPVVVQRSTGYVLAGNHTVQAAAEEGWATLPAVHVDCDDDTARRIVLVDNRSNDLAMYDDSALANLLIGLDGDMGGTGFEADDLETLLGSMEEGGFAGRDKDAAPALGETAITKPGDLIRLGDHVLLCGDSLAADCREALLQGQLADLVVTDPPYMVNHADPLDDGRSPESRHMRLDNRLVPNDKLSGVEAADFLAAAMVAVRDVLKPGGAFYIFSPPGETELDFRLGLRTADLQLRQALLWVKDQFVFGRQDYQWRHESILYGWRGGAGHYFVNDHTQDTIWECERPKRSKEHPTMKPVALLERAINNSSKKKELVVDLFGGSGSTLIACEATGRRCAIVELDPLYCDVIVARYERLTQTTVR